MQEADGSFRRLAEEEAGILRRIAEAGKRELPIFSVGEVISVRNANFRVLALDGHLLVLTGISVEEARAWFASQCSRGRTGGIPRTASDEIIEIDEKGLVSVVPMEP